MTTTARASAQPSHQMSINAGDQAPRLPIRDSLHKPRTITELSAEKPLVLAFLGEPDTPSSVDIAVALRDAGSHFEEAGATIAAVTAATPSDGAALRAKWNLSFLVLCDPEGGAFERFGVSPEAPGTFVIDTAGIVRFAHRNEGALDSPPTWTVIDAVCEITGKEVERPEPVAPELAPGVAPVQLGAKPMNAALSNYACAKCGCPTYDTEDLSTAGGWISRMFNFQHRRFTAVSCTRCAYTELYRTDASAISNAVDILAGS